LINPSSILQIRSNPKNIKLPINMILTVEIISVKKQLSPKKSNLFEMVVHSEVIKID